MFLIHKFPLVGVQLLGGMSGPVLIDPPPFLLSSKNEKQAEESKNLFSLLSIKDFYLIP